MFMGMGTDREMMDMVPVVAGKGRSEDNMATRASIARSIAMEAEGEDIMAPRSSNTVHRREAVVREAAQWVTAITRAEAEAGGRAMDKAKEDTVEMEMQVAEAVVVVDLRIIEAVMIRGMGMGMAGIEGSFRTWKKKSMRKWDWSACRADLRSFYQISLLSFHGELCSPKHHNGEDNACSAGNKEGRCRWGSPVDVWVDTIRSSSSFS
jgi:hypothetical protein